MKSLRLRFDRPPRGIDPRRLHRRWSRQGGKASLNPVPEQPTEEQSKSVEKDERVEEEDITSTRVRAVRHSELRGNPLSCGVESATGNFELPRPASAARNLVEQAHYAQLCTIMSNKHHRRAGYPYGTLVDFVSDGSGFPVLRLSTLAVPTRNVLENPKCSVVVQMPGWTGLANTRVTIFGDVYQLPSNLQEIAKQLFQDRNSKEDDILAGNSLYFRMHEIKDIFFVGGFGTVQWIDVQDYMSTEPDEIVSECTSADLQSLNQQFSDDLRRLLSQQRPVHEAHLISLDATGADIRTRTGGDFGVVRIGFDEKVTTVKKAKEAFQRTVNCFHKAP